MKKTAKFAFCASLVHSYMILVGPTIKHPFKTFPRHLIRLDLYMLLAHREYFVT